MIKYAEIDLDNNVVNLIVATEASIAGLPGTFIKYDIDSLPDRREATLGGTYNKDKDKFVYPKPYPSWILNSETLEWHSPIGDKPDDDKKYLWDEENQIWQEIIPIEINL